MNPEQVWRQTAILIVTDLADLPSHSYDRGFALRWMCHEFSSTQAWTRQTGTRQTCPCVQQGLSFSQLCSPGKNTCQNKTISCRIYLSEVAADWYRKELSHLDTPKIPAQKVNVSSKLLEEDDCGSEAVLIKMIVMWELEQRDIK